MKPAKYSYGSASESFGFKKFIFLKIVKEIEEGLPGKEANRLYELENLHWIAGWYVAALQMFIKTLKEGIIVNTSDLYELN